MSDVLMMWALISFVIFGFYAGSVRSFGDYKLFKMDIFIILITLPAAMTFFLLFLLGRKLK